MWARLAGRGGSEEGSCFSLSLPWKLPVPLISLAREYVV